MLKMIKIKVIPTHTKLYVRYLFIEYFQILSVFPYLFNKVSLLYKWTVFMQDLELHKVKRH